MNVDPCRICNDRGTTKGRLRFSKRVPKFNKLPLPGVVLLIETQQGRARSNKIINQVDLLKRRTFTLILAQFLE
jgi:hypothetical protein